MRIFSFIPRRFQKILLLPRADEWSAEIHIGDYKGLLGEDEVKELYLAFRSLHEREKKRRKVSSATF